jgi:hypothetical protein
MRPVAIGANGYNRITRKDLLASPRLGWLGLTCSREDWRTVVAANLDSPMALTRAMCLPGSLHDRIIEQLPFVRWYVIRDGTGTAP